MKERGLTLIEILIAMGLSVVVGALLVVIIVNSAGLYSRQTSSLQQGLNINDALVSVRQNIRQSSGVDASFVDGSTTYVSSAEQLVLKIPSTDNLGNNIANTFDFFIFFKDGNKLRLKTFPDPLSSLEAQDQIFSTGLDSLRFQYFDSSIPPQEVTPVIAKKVKITLAVKQRVGVGFEQQIATSEASLRND